MSEQEAVKPVEFSPAIVVVCSCGSNAAIGVRLGPLSGNYKVGCYRCGTNFVENITKLTLSVWSDKELE